MIVAEGAKSVAGTMFWLGWCRRRAAPPPRRTVLQRDASSSAHNVDGVRATAQFGRPSIPKEVEDTVRSPGRRIHRREVRCGLMRRKQGFCGVHLWPACMALGSDGRRLILPNGALPTECSLGRELTQEGNKNKGHASIVRCKCVFSTDTELQNDREGRKENFIPPAVRDMTLFCASN